MTTIAELDVEYTPDFLTADQAQGYLERILAEVEFKPETYNFQDTVITTKRLMSYHSELAYTYSGQVYSGKPWTPALLELKTLVEAHTGYTFNAVLCNRYNDGDAGMGWHSDKEKELGPQPTIASLSMGSVRTFAFRERRKPLGPKNPPVLKRMDLNSGSLLVMKGHTQDLFEHSVLKNKSREGIRLNLTFRKVVLT